jgi:hypothetical protein
MTLNSFPLNLDVRTLLLDVRLRVIVLAMGFSVIPETNILSPVELSPKSSGSWRSNAISGGFLDSTGAFGNVPVLQEIINAWMTIKQAALVSFFMVFYV